MFLVDRRGWSEVEGVVVAVYMIVGDEGCEVVIVVIVEDDNMVK